LRYFTVAGAQIEGHLGQSTPEATHLIKVACEAACQKRAGVEIFGTDYDTPDGTCIRDYIHVEDLAAAHLKALDYLDAGEPSTIINCGYGHGYSVRQVLDTVQKINGTEFPIQESSRRPGDPAQLIADNQKIRNLLQWKPRYDSLEVICETALNWERNGNQSVSATR
jgi:UDP-glucose 4-epimerase